MYRLLLIIQDQSGVRIEVLQRLRQRLQCLDSVLQFHSGTSKAAVLMPQAVLFTATASTRAYIRGRL